MGRLGCYAFDWTQDEVWGMGAKGRRVDARGGCSGDGELGDGCVSGAGLHHQSVDPIRAARDLGNGRRASDATCEPPKRPFRAPLTSPSSRQAHWSLSVPLRFVTRVRESDSKTTAAARLGLPPVAVTVTAVDSTAVFLLPEALTGWDGKRDGRRGRLDG
ncbi:hypothetical protein B0H19DRAFT_1086499 [Mycena capillaripes]|nr:hypothetical protein B0H19DRAFT_1086499 [Mycena capillaripes]